MPENRFPDIILFAVRRLFGGLSGLPGAFLRRFVLFLLVRARLPSAPSVRMTISRFSRRSSNSRHSPPGSAAGHPVRHPATRGASSSLIFKILQRAIDSSSTSREKKSCRRLTSNTRSVGRSRRITPSRNRTTVACDAALRCASEPKQTTSVRAASRASASDHVIASHAPGRIS